jgi:hypothetical protein
MERRKGFGTLAGALGSLGDRAPRLRVAGRETFDWVAGEPFGAAAMDRYLVSRDRIELLGELGPEELAQQRRACAFAVIPSPNDNYPNTCMEAMAAGQVTIAARAGGMAEMVQDGVSGLLFAPGDAKDLARAIERAMGMSDEQRETMGRAARERIASVCGDGVVVSKRLEHAVSLSPSLPSATTSREVAVLAFAGIDDGVRDALTAALRANGGLDAVIPWFARTGPDGREVVPCSTPCAEHPGLLVEHPGPIALDARWWRRLEADGVDADAAGVLRALVERGARVAVLPELVVGSGDPMAGGRPGTPTPQRLTDAERAMAHAHRDAADARRAAEAARSERDRALAELADIRASPAYRVAGVLARLRRRLLG